MANVKSDTVSTQGFNQLKNYYNPTTAKVVRAFAKGWSSRKVASQFGLSSGSVAAYKANFTRGTYDDLLAV